MRVTTQWVRPLWAPSDERKEMSTDIQEKPAAKPWYDRDWKSFAQRIAFWLGAVTLFATVVMFFTDEVGNVRRIEMAIATLVLLGVYVDLRKELDLLRLSTFFYSPGLIAFGVLIGMASGFDNQKFLVVACIVGVLLAVLYGFENRGWLLDNETSLGMVAVMLVAIVGFFFVAGGSINSASSSMPPNVVGTTTLPGANEPVEIRLDMASISEPIIGNGDNLATPPVLQDGKGDLQSWGDFVARVNALPEAARLQTMQNVNTWFESTSAKNKDPKFQFANWNTVTEIAALPGEYRVIAVVKSDISEQEAREAVRPRLGNLADTLPVVFIDNAILNTECGGGDCAVKPEPAQQFVDLNGQVRVMLTVPVKGKEGFSNEPNLAAAQAGIGLAVECGNGFLGTVTFAPEAMKMFYGTGNGDWTPETTPETTTPSTSTTTTTPSTSTTTTTPSTTTTTPSTSTTTTTPSTSTTTTTPSTSTTTTTPSTTTTTTTTTTTEWCPEKPGVPKDSPECKPKSTETSEYPGGTETPPVGTITESATPESTPEQPAGNTLPNAPEPEVTAPEATQPTIVAPPAPLPSSQAPTDGAGDVDPVAPAPAPAQLRTVAPAEPAPVQQQPAAQPPASAQAPAGGSTGSAEEPAAADTPVEVDGIEPTAASSPINGTGTLTLIVGALGFVLILIMIGGSVNRRTKGTHTK